MSSEWELDEGIKSIKSAWRREHTARANLEKMLEQAEAENAKLREERREYQVTIDSLVDECADHKDENARLRDELSNAESTIDYLGKENVDWEDKYRALAKDNAALRRVALDAYQYLYGLIYKSYTFVPERVQGIADSLRRLGVEVPDE